MHLLSERGELKSPELLISYILCVPLLREYASKPSDAIENRIGTLGPHKGFGLLVVHVDELQDGGFQFTHAVVRTSFDLPL